MAVQQYYFYLGLSSSVYLDMILWKCFLPKNLLKNIETLMRKKRKRKRHNLKKKHENFKHQDSKRKRNKKKKKQEEILENEKTDQKPSNNTPKHNVNEKENIITKLEEKKPAEKQIIKKDERKGNKKQSQNKENTSGQINPAKGKGKNKKEPKKDQKVQPVKEVESDNEGEWSIVKKGKVLNLQKQAITLLKGQTKKEEDMYLDEFQLK